MKNKSAIKNGVITRTFTFTDVKYLTLDLATREVKEGFKTLVMKYTEDEALAALKEQGINAVAIENLVYTEEKVALDYLTFYERGKIID